MATSQYTRSLMDYDEETSTVQVHATFLNDTNFAAQIVKQSTFGAAINDMSLGTLQKISYGNVVPQSNPPPSNQFAQRELKWRVDFTDDVTGKPYHFTIPCANAALLDPNNKGKADMDDADVADFVAATEDYVLSQDGNAITVRQIVLVGRNI